MGADIVRLRVGGPGFGNHTSDIKVGRRLIKQNWYPQRGRR